MFTSLFCKKGLCVCGVMLHLGDICVLVSYTGGLRKCSRLFSAKRDFVFVVSCYTLAMYVCWFVCVCVVIFFYGVLLHRQYIQLVQE